MLEHARGDDSTRAVTPADVIRQIEARLGGTIDDVALAAWAFDRFYAAELGAEELTSDAAATLADVLDALMFGDDPIFRLDEEELRALIARLSRL